MRQAYCPPHDASARANGRADNDSPVRPVDRIRQDPDRVRRELELRGFDAPLDRIIELDQSSRALQAQRDTLRAERNKGSKGGPPTEETKARMREVGERIKGIEGE